MKEFILPEDGLVVKSATGQPVVTLESLPEGNILKFFNSDGEPRITLVTQGHDAALFVGGSETENVAVAAGDAMSEVAVAHSGKNIALGIDSTHSEIRFVNAANAVTNKLYVDEHGGQIGLSDHQGNLILSAGAVERGGLLHLMNANADSVVVLDTNEDNGNITLRDRQGNIRMLIGHKDDLNIHLVDSDGHIVWSTSFRIP